LLRRHIEKEVVEVGNNGLLVHFNFLNVLQFTFHHFTFLLLQSSNLLVITHEASQRLVGHLLLRLLLFAYPGPSGRRKGREITTAALAGAFNATIRGAPNLALLRAMRILAVTTHAHWIDIERIHKQTTTVLCWKTMTVGRHGD